MHFADVDYLAHKGNSFWHKASAISKLFFTTAIITAIVIGNNITYFVFTFILLISLLLISGVPLLRFLHLFILPAFFASIFAFSRTGQFWPGGAVIILKAVTAAGSLILLITTTGAPGIFGCLRFFLPRIVSDILFLTYRSFFILSGSLNNLLTAIKIKGGYSPYMILLNLRSTAGALGLLLIHSVTKSEQLYKVLILRGYKDGIHGGGSWRRLTLYDLGPVLVGGAVLVCVVIS